MTTPKKLTPEDLATTLLIECPSCGAGNLESGKRCHACGRPLQRVTEYATRTGLGPEVGEGSMGQRLCAWAHTMSLYRN